MKTEQKIYRQSIIILIGRLILLQIGVILISNIMYFITTGSNQTPMIEWLVRNNLLYWTIKTVEIAATTIITMEWAAQKYEISQDKIIIFKGIFFEKENVYLIDNIESIKLKRSLLGIIFKFGTLKLYAPTLREFIKIRNVHNAKKIAKKITRYISEKEKSININAN